MFAHESAFGVDQVGEFEELWQEVGVEELGVDQGLQGGRVAAEEEETV